MAITVRRQDKLFAASFRGIEFFIRSESMPTAGRKVVLHEYPDSDRRFVEDLGQLPPIFSVDAFVSGDQWREDSFSLEKELNTPGVGELILPVFGSIDVYPMPYTKDASQQNIGEIVLKLQFATGKPSTAGIATPTLPIVYDAGDSFRTGLVAKFEQLLKVAEYVNNKINDISDLVDLALQMKSELKRFMEGDFIGDFEKQIDDIVNRASSITSDTEDYSKRLIQGDTLEDGLWQITSVGFGNQGAVDAALAFTKYGDTLLESDSSQDVAGSTVVENSEDETSEETPYWPATTKERIDRNASRRLLVRTTRINALIAAYEQLAAGLYNTTLEINEARDKVEAVYKQIMLEGAQDPTAIHATSEIRPLIEKVRSSSLAVLGQKEQEAFGLTTIDQNYKTSQFSLAYNLYAEAFTNSVSLTERGITVRKLNPDINGLIMKGELNVLSTGGR